MLQWRIILVNAHCQAFFPSISFSSHNNMRHVLLFIPLYRWENCIGLERLSNVAGDSSNKWQSEGKQTHVI